MAGASDTGRWAIAADPGIDDAVAMAVLAGLGAVPDLVVSQPGNVDGATAAGNAAGLVALLGWEVPVEAFGAGEPAVQKAGRGDRHGEDGLGGVAHHLPPAPVPGEVGPLPRRLFVTGPLAAVESASSIDALLWMGGAVGRDRPAEAEFNAWCAPEAADRVLRAHGAVTSVVPLDVTSRVDLGERNVASWRSGGPAARLLADALASWGEAAGLVVHDAVAAVAWRRPDLFTWERRALRCGSGAADRGLLHDRGPGPSRVAVDLDVEAVRRTIVDAVRSCG